MAYHFKELFNITPFCIEQTKGDRDASLLNNHFLAINADTTRRESCDMFLYNNTQESQYKVKPNADEKAIHIDLSMEAKSKLKEHKQLALMVYYKDEFNSFRFLAVPVINKLIVNEKETIIINLPQGEYHIVFRTPTSFVVEELKMRI